MIDTLHLVLIAVGQVLWFVYLLNILTDKITPVGRSAKTGSVVVLGVLGILAESPSLIVIALFISAIGDFALTFKGHRAFLIGLVAFAVAHLFYINQFFVFVEIPQLVELSFYLRPESLFMIAMFIVGMVVIHPHAGSLKTSVFVYIAIIFTMGLFGLQLPFPFRLAALGVLLFIISDFLLGIREFRDIANPMIDRLLAIGVWVFYWFGQFLILIGFIYP